MLQQMIQQARGLLGRRRPDSDLRWFGQMGFACPQLGIHDFQWNPNRVVNSGLNHLLNAGLRGEGILTNFYLAPFATDVAPAAGVTAATFGSTLTEFVNYSEVQRPQWVSDAAATAQFIENAAAPAVYTIGSGAQTAIHGAGLMSIATKGSGSGLLIAAAKAPNPFLGLADGFEVKIRWKLTGASS